jgi:hypothetical protein
MARDRNRTDLPTTPVGYSLWAFAGKRWSRGSNRSSVVFYSVDDEGIPELDDPHVFSKTRLSVFQSAQIGVIYAIQTEPNEHGTVTATWPRAWFKADSGKKVPLSNRLDWETEQRVDTTEKNARNQGYPELDCIVSELRDVRNKLAPTKRTTFDVWLLQEIQKGTWRS